MKSLLATYGLLNALPALVAAQCPGGLEGILGSALISYAPARSFCSSKFPVVPKTTVVTVKSTYPTTSVVVLSTAVATVTNTITLPNVTYSTVSVATTTTTLTATQNSTTTSTSTITSTTSTLVNLQNNAAALRGRTVGVQKGTVTNTTTATSTTKAIPDSKQNIFSVLISQADAIISAVCVSCIEKATTVTVTTTAVSTQRATSTSYLNVTATASRTITPTVTVVSTSTTTQTASATVTATLTTITTTTTTTTVSNTLYPNPTCASNDVFASGLCHCCYAVYDNSCPRYSDSHILNTFTTPDYSDWTDSGCAAQCDNDPSCASFIIQNYDCNTYTGTPYGSFACYNSYGVRDGICANTQCRGTY